MVATEFSDLYNTIKNSGQVGVLDLADKLNTILTASVFVICILAVTVKQYFQSPISCYTATPIGGENIKDYIQSYCWVQGTIALPVERALEVTNEEWEDHEKHRVAYYQWIPFVLAMQCVLFIIPRFLWQMFTYNRTGTDLEKLLKTASEGSGDDPESKQKKIEHVSQTLTNVIMATRETGQGQRSVLRRQIFNFFGFLTFSKRTGTWICAIYLLMKLLYLGNSVGQLFLMQYFLGLHKNYTVSFGATLLNDIIAGKDWRQTYVFPRVTFCRVNFQQLGAINYQTSQCVLGINYLYEKIYIFLWFWLVMISFFTAFSIPLWFLRLTGTGSRVTFIKRNLMVSNKFCEKDRKLIDPFTRLFLRHDGLFILRMLSLNAGDYMTSEVIGVLFESYKKNLTGRNMFDDRRYAEFGDDEQLLQSTDGVADGTVTRRPGKIATSEC